MASDLVSCADKKPKDDEGAGLSWAGIEPPLLPERCPPVTRTCKRWTRICNSDKHCVKAIKLGIVKGATYLGCHAGKESLNMWFDMKANCCDPTNIGFSDNIPMFKMQISDMPSYHASGTDGRFKANRGVGSVCTMMKSLVAGVESAIDEKEDPAQEKRRAERAAARKAAKQAKQKAAKAKGISVKKSKGQKVQDLRVQEEEQGC